MLKNAFSLLRLKSAWLMLNTLDYLSRAARLPARHACLLNSQFKPSATRTRHLITHISIYCSYFYAGA